MWDVNDSGRWYLVVGIWFKQDVGVDVSGFWFMVFGFWGNAMKTQM